jgi:hypothetical protein
LLQARVAGTGQDEGTGQRRGAGQIETHENPP